MEFFLIWICLGLVGSMIASSKGNSGCGGFILGILLGPIGLLIAFFSSDDEGEKRRRTGDTKKCPYCAEYVKQEAKVCKHCGRTLEKDSITLDSSTNFDIENFRKQ